MYAVAAATHQPVGSMIDQHKMAIDRMTERIEVVMEPFQGFHDLIFAVCQRGPEPVDESIPAGLDVDLEGAQQFQKSDLLPVEIGSREIAALVLGHALDGVDGAQRGDMPHRGNLDGDAPGA
ncbi:MAG TPA: hypothetical protein PLT68_08850, partial [Actinomycetota bacterium]|nr:hypothetical protein [Actinomycetota bacterium]